MLDWVDETPTGLDQVSAFSADGNRAARIRVESFKPDVHRGVILEAMTAYEQTGLTPAQLQTRVAELEGALAAGRERICAAIKAEDDYCVTEGDYMLDSDDCIKIVRGVWVRPDYSVGPHP